MGVLGGFVMRGDIWGEVANKGPFAYNSVLPIFGSTGLESHLVLSELLLSKFIAKPLLQKQFYLEVQYCERNLKRTALVDRMVMDL